MTSLHRTTETPGRDGEPDGGDATNRVLVVETEPAIRALLFELLTAPGRPVDVAGSYEEGLRCAEQHPPSVALVEKSLRGRSGLELTRALRSIDPLTEVVLMSALPTPDSVIEAVTAGASDYLAKPFEDIEQVAVRVKNAEDRAALRRERARLEQRLRESEERYRKLFEASPDAVLLVDEGNGLIRDANGAALRLYGYASAEIVGRDSAELRWPEDGSDELAGPEVAGRRVDRDRHGSRVDVEVSSGRCHMGDRPMIVDVVRDIRERLRAEQARRSLELQLQHAQKIEALGQLAGAIAHDFNNLLAVILNYGEFVAHALTKAPPEYAEARDDLEQMQHAASSAVSVTRQLLAFSRHDLAAPELIDLNEVIAAVEKLLQRTVGADVRLRSALATPLPLVHADRGQLEQVIVNLVVNARDAMSRGGSIVISTGSVEPAAEPATGESAGLVWLEVADTGSGIPADIRERIFDPFFTTKTRGKGTGLGLATVKGIVEGTGGRIVVRSTLGQGTTFRIELPARVGLKRATSSPPLGADPGRAHPGERVLVVDDDDATRRAMCRILVGAGYEVLEARDGEEALAEHGKLERVDLLLTDIVMPGMSGNDVAARLVARQPDLKVIYVTGYAVRTQVDPLGATGDRAVLPKPFRDVRLRSLVRQVMDAGASRPPTTHRGSQG